jgi:uncharacterized protein YaiL (DUF2058 family)
MASLQDQLLKAGLVDKHKAKLATKEKQKQANQARKSGAKTVNAARTAAAQRHAERVERDRALNQQKQDIARQKAIAAQVRQLIEVNKLERGQGEHSYSFEHENKVKNILVTEDQRNHLTQGRLAIVATRASTGSQFEVVAAPVAQKIAERDAESIVRLNEREEADTLEDDPYADYQIPDDLTW